MAVNKSAKMWVGPSNSDQYLGSRSTVPQVSAIMSKSVSDIRRQAISGEVDQDFLEMVRAQLPKMINLRLMAELYLLLV